MQTYILNWFQQQLIYKNHTRGHGIEKLKNYKVKQLNCVGVFFLGGGGEEDDCFTGCSWPLHPHFQRTSLRCESHSIRTKTSPFWNEISTTAAWYQCYLSLCTKWNNSIFRGPEPRVNSVYQLSRFHPMHWEDPVCFPKPESGFLTVVAFPANCVTRSWTPRSSRGPQRRPCTRWRWPLCNTVPTSTWTGVGHQCPRAWSSRFPWWFSACWTRLWESCPRWTLLWRWRWRTWFCRRAAIPLASVPSPPSRRGTWTTPKDDLSWPTFCDFIVVAPAKKVNLVWFTVSQWLRRLTKVKYKKDKNLVKKNP